VTDKWGVVTYRRRRARGGERARGTRNLTGKSFLFFWHDRRQPAGHPRFDGPRFIHSASPRGFQPQQTPASQPSTYWGYDSSLACGPVHFVLAPLNQKKKIDKSGRNHRALPDARWLIKEMMDRSLTCSCVTNQKDDGRFAQAQRVE
jgi:hypothetical protein